MNFQQAVAKLKLESPRQGPAPASIATSAKDDSRLWGWVSDSWLTLQTCGTPWNFLRQAALVPLVAAKNEYTTAEMGLVLGVQRLWLCDDYYRPRIINGIDSYGMSKELSYDAFRRQMDGMANGLPQFYCWTPAGTLMVGPAPDRALTMSIDVIRGESGLATETAEFAGLPTRHHNLIVWDALKRLAIHDASGEALARANKEYDDAWNRLWCDQGPVFSMERRG
jgi:hypothetical protein